MDGSKFAYSRFQDIANQDFRIQKNVEIAIEGAIVAIKKMRKSNRKNDKLYYTELEEDFYMDAEQAKRTVVLCPDVADRRADRMTQRRNAICEVEGMERMLVSETVKLYKEIKRQAMISYNVQL